MSNLPTGMNWYIAKIVYQIVSGNGKHKAQFDEQFRLIKADELDWAWEKAQVIGRLEENAFLNNKKEYVEWKYIAVEDVMMINALEDGAQLYARTAEPDNFEEYIEFTKSRATRFLDCRSNAQ
ncbi:MAG TPA: DUF4288 domain-containing protein [Cyclobacteriaceae bacterium]|nr:DUF4288 domain-containing protein [Cyclobacteriaceae bacterium]